MRVGTDAVLLGAWAKVEGAQHILDVGTGTGVIALICAQRNSEASIEAVEIDEGSALDAQYNFTASRWNHRLRLFHGDYLKVASGQKFDLIISNPPFFSQSLRASDPIRNAARHDDALPAEAFMRKSRELITAEGIIALIFPTHQLEKWTQAAAACGIAPVRICHVFTLPYKEPARVMVEFSRQTTLEPKMESMLIGKSPGIWSEAYKQLTLDLYTKW